MGTRIAYWLAHLHVTLAVLGSFSYQERNTQPKLDTRTFWESKGGSVILIISPTKGLFGLLKYGASTINPGSHCSLVASVLGCHSGDTTRLIMGSV